MSRAASLSLSEITVGEVHHQEPDEIIEANHYLGTCPDPTRHRYLITGGFRVGVIGAAIWGRPASRNFNQETTVELRRFWTADDTPQNTESKALSMMMRDMEQKGYHRLLSYSSVGQGHNGIIYRATNWTNLGLRWPSSTWDNRDGRTMSDAGVKWLFEYVFEDGWYSMDNEPLEL